MQLNPSVNNYVKDTCLMPFLFARFIEQHAILLLKVANLRLADI